jgi:hypothetical protein
MRIDIPKVVRPLALSGYAAEYGAAMLSVWVNPPKQLSDSMLKAFARTEALVAELRKTPKDKHNDAKRDELDAIGEQVTSFLSEIWSQGHPETHMSVEDVRELVQTSRESDPALWPWITRQTWTMILEYRAGVKKK